MAMCHDRACFKFLADLRNGCVYLAGHRKKSRTRFAAWGIRTRDF